MKCDKTSFHIHYANDIKRNSAMKPVKRQETSGCSLKYIFHSKIRDCSEPLNVGFEILILRKKQDA